MNTQYDVQLTPDVARRLVRLKSIIPSIKLDQRIVDYAEANQLQFDPSLSSNDQRLFRDLFDFDFRATIGLPETIRLFDKTWLAPVLAAARLRGFEHIVVGSTGGLIKFDDIVKMGWDSTNVHEHEDWVSLGEDSGIPRNALFLSFIGENYGAMPISHMEFFHTLNFMSMAVARRGSIFDSPLTPSVIYKLSSTDIDELGLSTTMMNKLSVLFNYTTISIDPS